MVSLRAFARARKVRLSAVQKAIKSGRITAIERDAKGRVIGIDELKAAVEWDRNTDPVEAARNGKLGQLEVSAEPPAAAPPTETPKPPGSQESYLDHRARRELFESKTAELDYLKAVGRLVSADEMRDASFRRYRTLRDKLLNVPDRIATIVAAERDPVVVHKLLTDEIKRVLNEFSDGARSSATGGDPERMAA